MLGSTTDLLRRTLRFGTLEQWSGGAVEAAPREPKTVFRRLLVACGAFSCRCTPVFLIFFFFSFFFALGRFSAFVDE